MSGGGAGSALSKGTMRRKPTTTIATNNQTNKPLPSRPAPTPQTQTQTPTPRSGRSKTSEINTGSRILRVKDDDPLSDDFGNLDILAPPAPTYIPGTMSSQKPSGRPSQELLGLYDERGPAQLPRLLDGPAHTPVIQAPAKTIGSMYAMPFSETRTPTRKPVPAQAPAQQEQKEYSEAQAAGRAAMYNNPQASFLSNNNNNSAVRRKPAPTNIRVPPPPRVDKQAERGAENQDADGGDIGARGFHHLMKEQQPTVATAAASNPQIAKVGLPTARTAAPAVAAQKDPPTEYEILREGFNKVKAWNNQRRDGQAQQKLVPVPQDGYMPSQAVPEHLPAPMLAYAPPGAEVGSSAGTPDGTEGGGPPAAAAAPAPTPSEKSATTNKTGKSGATASSSKSYFDPLRRVIQRKLDGSGGVSKPKHENAGKPTSSSQNPRAGKSNKAAQLQAQADGVTWATLNNVVHKDNDDAATPKGSDQHSRCTSRDKINTIYAAYAAEEEARRKAEHEAQLQKRKAAISRPDSRDGKVGAAGVFEADRFNAVHRNKDLPPHHLAEPSPAPPTAAAASSTASRANEPTAGTKQKQAAGGKNLVHVVVNDGGESEHRAGERRGTTLGDFINHNPKKQKTAAPPVPSIPVAAFHLPFGSNNKSTNVAASANRNADTTTTQTHSKKPSAGSNKTSEKTNSSSNKHTHTHSGASAFLAKLASASGSHHYARKDSVESDMSFKCAGIAEEDKNEDALLAPEQIVARENAERIKVGGGSSSRGSEGLGVGGGVGTSTASSATGKQTLLPRRAPEAPSRLQPPPSQGYRHHDPQPQNIPYPGGSHQPLHRKPVATSSSSRTRPNPITNTNINTNTNTSAPPFPQRKKAKCVNCGHTGYSASGETEGDYWLCDECKSKKPPNFSTLTPRPPSAMQKKSTSLWAELVPEPLRWVKWFKLGNGDSGSGGEPQPENAKKKSKKQAQQSAWPKDTTTTNASAGTSSSSPFSYTATPPSLKQQPTSGKFGSSSSATIPIPILPQQQALKPPPASAQPRVYPKPPIGLGLTNVPLPPFLGSTTPSSSYYPTDPSTALRNTHTPLAPSASIREHAHAPSAPSRAAPSPPAPHAYSPPRQHRRPLSSPSSISSPVGQDISFLTHRNRETLLIDSRTGIPSSFPSPPPIPSSPGDWRVRVRNRRRSSTIHVDLSTLGGGPHGGLQKVSEALRASSIYSPHPRNNNTCSSGTRRASVAMYTDPGNPWEMMSTIGEEKQQEKKRNSPVSPVNTPPRHKTTVRKDGFTFVNYGEDVSPVSPVSPASPLAHPLQQKQMRSAMMSKDKAGRKSWWRPDRANPGDLEEVTEPRLSSEERNTAFYGFYEEILRGLKSPASPPSCR
ncbi:MAG: hypothetical protein M1831_004830 [Alyxoria varia]|nr:MAG: hypothetical protein M1831_004830 [Alyxoria varia]